MPGGSRPRAVFAFGACRGLGGASLESGWPSSAPSPHEERFSMAYVIVEASFNDLRHFGVFPGSAFSGVLPKPSRA